MAQDKTTPNTKTRSQTRVNTGTSQQDRWREQTGQTPRRVDDEERGQGAQMDYFNGGRFGGQDQQNDPYSYQPTPQKAAEMGYTGTGMEVQPAAGNAQEGQNPMQGSQDSVQGTQITAQDYPQARRDVIGKEQVRKAAEILKKYKQGKQRLEDRIVRNEKWWKLRHWDLMKTEDTMDDPKPASGWLFNTIISKHADFMDNFPSADVLPRESGDVEEATRLSSIIPVVMDQVGYRNVYSDEVWYKLKHGTGVFGVFWDAGKLNGLGDISIKQVDLLSIFWEPGVTDIQKSQNVFTVELVDSKLLEQSYPQVQGVMAKGRDDSILKKYMYDESIDTTGKSAVIDWYYKKNVNGKMTLHYCKFVGETVLYATENDTQRPTQDVPQVDPVTGAQYVQTVETGESMAEKGLYDHAMYPFIFDTLFPDAGMLCGFGFVDVCKNAQMSIDIYNNCFEKNVQYMASPRFFVRNDGGINEEEFANPSNLLVHTDSNLGQDSIRVVDTPQLINSNYINILEYKINEMKETAGNRDATNGGTVSGVTAASAIAAMQESSGKTSRDQIATTYEAHKQIVTMVIELIRQFYDMPRQFRIIGADGQQRFTEYSNTGLQPQSQGMEFGVDMGYRLPVFDVIVEAEKESSYSRLSQNELAMQFYNAGFFNPQLADQALACLGMMDFQGKSEVTQKIQANGTLYQQLIMMQQQMLQMAEVVEKVGGQQYAGFADGMAQQINANLNGQQATATGGGNIDFDGSDAESAYTKGAREQAAERATPN